MYTKVNWIFKFFLYIFLLFSFEANAFNPGKNSQFIGANIFNASTGIESLNISDPKKIIILIYNQGWGQGSSKSKVVRGKDNCFVDQYLKNQKIYIPGKFGPWYSLASEYHNVIKNKKIMLYYFCKNRAQAGLNSDTLRALLTNNLIKLVDAFVEEGVPRQNIIPIGHSGGATVVIEAMYKKSNKINSVIATSWSVAGEKPWKANDATETKRFAVKYLKNNKPFNALIFACDQDPFTNFDEQKFWNEVKGVEYIKLKGEHSCWFKLFKDSKAKLSVLNFIQKTTSN